MKLSRYVLVAPFGVAALLLAASLSACSSNSCGSGQTEVPVQNDTGGGASRQHICLPDSPTTAAPTATASATTTAPTAHLPPTLPPSDAGPHPPAPTACTTADAGTLDVRVLSKTGAAATPSGTPPNGTFTLVQASFYAVDAGAPPIAELRATLIVTGARLDLAARAIDGTLQPDESFTLAVAGGALVTSCESRSDPSQAPAGPIATGLFPGGVGASEPAQVGWDPRQRTLTLVVHTVSGDVELLFVGA